MTPTSTPILRNAVRWSLIIGAALLLILGSIGAAVSGVAGLATACVGVLVSVGFMAITALSIVVANRFANNDLFVGAFFGIVMGGWLVKFVFFIGAMVLLRGAPWVDLGLLFASLVSGIIGSLAVDVIVL
ncbi:MAG: hypothetical protein ACKOXM_06055, partial [Agromyces sp.]